MIIKGGSRSGPKQLARHLLRSDTNEEVKVLELQSPTGDLAEALRDWQIIADGTRGTKGLYHANIDPDAKYTMTEDQWTRSVDRLEKELGLEGQPRAVVLHQKDGRQHIHVVWQRTDITTMTLVSDSNNYAAHERASLALEKEFGHDIVPGKHAKRDREQQPEIPKSEINHAEWQQAERLGLDIKEFRARITDIYERSDNPQALIAGLNDAGLIVARGDKTPYVVVDTSGTHHNLARQITSTNLKGLRAFMAGVDETALPSIDEAKALQQSRQPQDAALQKEPTLPETQTQAPPDAPASTDEPPPAPSSSSAEIERLKEALRTRYEQELQKYHEFHAAERAQREFILEQEANERIADLDARQKAVIDGIVRERAAERQGFAGLIAAIWARVNPAAAAREREEREADRAAIIKGLAKERQGELALIETVRGEQLDELAERQAQQLRDAESRYKADEERHLSDRAEADRLLARIEEQRRLDAERLQNRPPGMGPPGTL